MVRVCHELGVDRHDSVLHQAFVRCIREDVDPLREWSKALQLLERGLEGELTIGVRCVLLRAAGEPRAAYPVNPTVTLRNDRLVIDPEPQAPVRLGTLLWGLAGVLAGSASLEAWLTHGTRVAHLVGLVASARRWFVLQDDSCPEGTVDLLTQVVLSDPTHGPEFAMNHATTLARPDLRRHLRRVLVQPAVAERIRSVWAATVDDVMSADRTGHPMSADLVHELDSYFDVLWNTAELSTLIASMQDFGGKNGASATPAEAIALAVDCLRTEMPWRDSWDHQIVAAPAQATICAQWFVRGLVLEGLANAGVDVTPHIDCLLGEIPLGELRYFSHWSGIPPDSDSLGLMLSLAARLPDPPHEKVSSWLEVLMRSLDRNLRAPTWLTAGASALAWRGNDCADARLRLVHGLAAWAPAEFRKVIESNLDAVLVGYRDGRLEGGFYYADGITSLLFTRACEACRAGLRGSRVVERAHRAGLEIAESLQSTQRLDGSWGTPQATAATLECYGRLAPDPDPHTIERACRHLADTQGSSGFWPVEPLYLTLAKHGGTMFHGGRSLTTAICLGALATASTRLESLR